MIVFINAGGVVDKVRASEEIKVLILFIDLLIFILFLWFTVVRPEVLILGRRLGPIVFGLNIELRDVLIGIKFLIDRVKLTLAVVIGSLFLFVEHVEVYQDSFHLVELQLDVLVEVC